MEFRKLEERDVCEFSELIENMYSGLENLEWFTPMPFDEESVLNMIQKPRFYILGAFEDDKLVGVSSLDYKCGKLLGKIDFPTDCNTEKLVEIGFNLVHLDYRGNKIMQRLMQKLIEKLQNDGYEWVFVKVHKDNIASNKSCYNLDFKLWKEYRKTVNKEEFENLANQPFFSKEGKVNAEKTLAKFANKDEIVVDYNILIRKV